MKRDTRTISAIQFEIDQAYRELPLTACDARREQLWGQIDRGLSEIKRRQRP